MVLLSVSTLQLNKLRLTVLSWFFLVFEAVRSISVFGWKAVDTIGVVRCSKDLIGSGKICCDASTVDLEREEEEYRFTIPVDDLLSVPLSAI